MPLDGAPLIIGGRIYADLSTGTAGMQLSTYTSDESLTPGGNAVLVMPGAQTNLRFRTNIGIFAQGDEPTPVEIKAIKQDGTEAATFTYTLNDPGHSGAFTQIPITEGTFPGIDGNAMTIKVKALSGSPIGCLHRHRRPDLDGHGLHPGQARQLRPFEFFACAQKGRPSGRPYVFRDAARLAGRRGGACPRPASRARMASIA